MQCMSQPPLLSVMHNSKTCKAFCHITADFLIAQIQATAYNSTRWRVQVTA